jgi:hypothetical protein
MSIVDPSSLYNTLLSIDDYKLFSNLYYYKPGFLNRYYPLDF